LGFRITGSLFFGQNLKFAQKAYFFLKRINLFCLQAADKKAAEILKPEGGMETYLKASEVAELLQLSEQTIRRYTMERSIPFHKINRSVRFVKADIERWVADGNRKTGGNLFDGAKV